MEKFNHTLFLFLNAPAEPSVFLLSFAKIMAEQIIWAVPLVLLAGWLFGTESTRKQMLAATASGLLGLMINQVIGLAWYHPRPFEIGLGHTMIAHATDSSFPSDHLTLMWSVACSFLLHEKMRIAGVLLALLGLPVAWARLYLGVHFPLDMAGAAFVAVLSAWVIRREGRWIVEPVFRIAQPAYRLVFFPLIKRRWLSK